MPDSLSNRISGEYSPAYRLLRSVGYGRTLKSNSVVDHKVKIFYSANGTNKSRLGIVSSKRIFPLASQRNTLKRAVREVFRQHRIKFDGLDLVVMPLKSACIEAKHSDWVALFGRIQKKCVDC